MPKMASASKPARPSSSNVGTSGSEAPVVGCRWRWRAAPAFHVSMAMPGSNTKSSCPASRSLSASAGTVGHMNSVRAGHLLEQFRSEMRRTADAGRSVIAFSRVGLEIGDKRLVILRRIFRPNDQIEGNARDGGDGNDVLCRVEGHAGVDVGIDRDQAA